MAAGVDRWIDAGYPPAHVCTRGSFLLTPNQLVIYVYFSVSVTTIETGCLPVPHCLSFYRGINYEGLLIHDVRRIALRNLLEAGYQNESL